MKLHRIILENLNSLYGSHSIDLSRDLRDAPLFLIMGQTGAGKSTILDAICLSLFGETPRLTRERGKTRTDSRIIMSQGTGECTAAVEFSKLVQDGTRRYYRASWTCRRSRGRADGRLQSPERSMELLDENRQQVEVLVSGHKRSDYEPVFNKILEGMNVSDFKRSMLLAQGEFSAFIRADREARASILERLTNTEVYRHIGKRAALKMRDAKEIYQKHKAEAEAISLLTPFEVEELRTRHKVAEAHYKAKSEALEVARLEEQWFARRVSLLQRQTQSVDTLAKAEATLEARAEDVTRLEEDARCQVAAPVLAELARLHPALDEAQQEVARYEEAERGYQVSLEDAETVEAVALKRKTDCIAHLDEMRPLLQKSRELRQKLNLARSEHRMARYAFIEAEEKENEAREGLKVAEEQFALAESKLERSQRQSERVAAYEPLMENISMLKERHRQLSDFDAGLERQRKQASAAEESIASLEAQSNTEAEQLAEVEAALAPLIQSKEEASQALQALLDGALNAQERREALEESASTLATRTTSLERAIRLSSEKEKLESTRKTLAVEVEEGRSEVERATKERGELQEAGQGLQTRLGELREHLDDLKLAVSLSHERTSLKSGRPCALCGSHEHPYTNDQDLKAQDERLRERCDAQADKVIGVERELQVQAQSIATLTTRVVSLGAVIDERQARLAELSARLEEVSQELSGALAKVETKEEGLEALKALFGASLEAQDALTATRRALESAEATWRARDKELRDSGTRAERLRGSLENLQARIQVHQQTLARVREELATIQGQRREVEDGLAEALRTYQVEIPYHPNGQANLDGALGEATRLVGVFLDRRNALGVATLEREASAKARDAARAQWGEAHRRFEERAEILKERQTHMDALELDVTRDRFAGDPEEREREFMEAVRDAERVFMEAQKRSAGLREERNRAQTLRKEKQKLSLHLTEEIKTQEAALVAHLEALGLANREALLAALLGDKTRRELQEALQVLQQAIRDAQTALDLVRAELDKHEEERPGGLLLTTNTDELTRRRLEAQQAQEEAMREHVQLQTRLDDQERLAKEQERLRGELEVVTREYELWKEMHTLIGVKEGENFKLFAQILNLQELIDKANIRLSWLQPRYTLVVARDDEGEPTLDFAVRDAHYAGQERPLTTLSGGETFLVSLSMALALADYRSVRMPIETLLLDEGLGTLDEETLDIVISALERLHSRGTQVGIISHIASLQERLQARVVVEKQGGGRSAFRFEFGQTP